MESVAIFRRQTLLHVRVVKIMFASWGDECTPVKHLARVCFKPTSEELWSNSVLICLKGFLDAFIPHISFFKGGLNLLKGHRVFVWVCVCVFFFFFSAKVARCEPWEDRESSAGPTVVLHPPRVCFVSVSLSLHANQGGNLPQRKIAVHWLTGEHAQVTRTRINVHTRTRTCMQTTENENACRCPHVERWTHTHTHTHTHT